MTIGQALDDPAPAPDTAPAAVLDGEIDAAFGLLQAGFERLLEISDRGDVCALGPDRLIEFAQRLETHRSRLQAVDIAIVEAAREERLDEHLCSRTLAIALADVLRISRGTARARVARAQQLMPQNAFSTASTAELPVLADAVRSGAVTGDQVAVIGPAMKTLRTNPQIGVEDAQHAERTLVEQSAALGPEALKVVAAKIDEVLLPDGVLPREDLAAARRGLRIGPERRDGTHSITGNLTRSTYARLMAVLSPLAAPRPEDDDLGADTRSQPQRMHDALEDAASRLLDTAGLPRSGGTPATVHITIDVDQLTAALAAYYGTTHYPSLKRAKPFLYAPTRASGHTSFDGQLTFGEIARLAEQARLVPTYVSATGGVLAYGANRRCATEGQTHALIARDHGCSFPGCDIPPEWCERHHVIPWYRGGPTDLDNLTLVCGYHHREFEKRGWQVIIHHGLPVWIPPRNIDRDQHPRGNIRIYGTDPLTVDVRTAHRIARQNADYRPPHPPSAGERLRSAPRGDRPAPADDQYLDDLDPLPEIVRLLAMHINHEEREEFKYDLDVVLDSYIGPNAPANQHLASA